MISTDELFPEHTAVRVSLWRALHTKLDDLPFVFEDTLGEEIIGEANWQKRPDMHPEGSKKIRASIVARSRIIEDLIEDSIANGIDQFVILGAGLDTFALRRRDLQHKIRVFEIDQEIPQKWKINRLKELKITIPSNLVYVPVDFESNEDWLEKLKENSFDFAKSTVIVSTGVTMYLTLEANLHTLRKINQLKAGSIFATTFMLPPNHLDFDDRKLMEFSMLKAAESGTPFISLFTPAELELILAKEKIANYSFISHENICEKYFNNRSDNLRPAKGEYFLIAKIN